MAVTKINKAQFGAEVSASHGDVLIDFSATWCGPCKMLAPIVEQFAEKHADIPVYTVDIDEETDLAVSHGVAAVPTLILFREGKPYKKSVGLVSLEDIEAMI